MSAWNLYSLTSKHLDDKTEIQMMFIVGIVGTPSLLPTGFVTESSHFGFETGVRLTTEIKEASTPLTI